MADQDNIDAFNEHVSQTFALLYGGFPTPVTLSADVYDLSLPDDIDVAMEQSKAFEPVAHAIRWLIDEGYVRCREALGDDVFLGAQLTARGLLTLNSVPRSIDGTGSLGRRMKLALSGGAKHLAGKLAEEAISAGFQLMTRSMLQ